MLPNAIFSCAASSSSEASTPRCSVEMSDCDTLIKHLEVMLEFSSVCWMAFSASEWYIQVADPFGVAFGELRLQSERLDRLVVEPAGGRDSTADELQLHYYLNLTELVSQLSKGRNQTTIRDRRKLCLTIQSKPHHHLEFTVSERKEEVSPVPPLSSSPTDRKRTASTAVARSASQKTRARPRRVAVPPSRGGGGGRMQQRPVKSESVLPSVSLPQEACLRGESHSGVGTVGVAGGIGGGGGGGGVNVLASFVLGSQSPPQGKYRTLPSSLPPDRIRLELEASNWNAILRESSVISHQLALVVQPRTRQVAFASHGEMGEMSETVQTVWERKQASHISLRLPFEMVKPEEEEVAAADSVASDDTVVWSGERYLNHSLKFLNRLLLPQLTVQLAFAQGAPLLLTMDSSPTVRFRCHFYPARQDWTEILPPPLSSSSSSSSPRSPSAASEDDGRRNEQGLRKGDVGLGDGAKILPETKKKKPGPTEADEWTDSSAFVQRSACRYTITESGKRHLKAERFPVELVPGSLIPDLFRHESPIVPGQFVRRVRLELPTVLTAAFWQRHRYSLADLEETIRAYKTYHLWSLALLLHLPIATTAVRLTYESADALIYSGRQLVCKHLMAYFRGDGKLKSGGTGGTSDAGGSDAGGGGSDGIVAASSSGSGGSHGSATNLWWDAEELTPRRLTFSNHTALTFRQCWHEPRLPVHKVSTARWESLLSLLSTRKEIRHLQYQYAHVAWWQSDQQDGGSPSAVRPKDRHTFPVIPFALRPATKQHVTHLELLRLLPLAFYLQHCRPPECLTHEPIRVQIQQRQYVGTLESFYVVSASSSGSSVVSS